MIRTAIFPAPGGPAQDAAEGLDDAAGAALGIGEPNGVRVGHIDAFAQDTDVGQHGPVDVVGRA